MTIEPIAPGPLAELKSVSVELQSGRNLLSWRPRKVRIIDDVSLTIMRGRTVGLVGESGSGKTTTGKVLSRQLSPSSGQVWFDGLDISSSRGPELRRLRRRMQMVFQDPYSSLNPKLLVGTSLAEPLIVHRTVANRQEARSEAVRLLEMVGLPSSVVGRYPESLSGGQRQRVGIARALALHPDLVVADEPVSALDVSIQAQIIDLMLELQERLGLAYLLISHDIALVSHLAHEVAVMYAGQIVEYGHRSQVLGGPCHPYTEALLSAVPVPNPREERQRRRIVLIGQAPNPGEHPSGCRFHSRCPIAQELCRSQSPPLEKKTNGQFAACWFRP